MRFLEDILELRLGFVFDLELEIELGIELELELIACDAFCVGSSLSGAQLKEACNRI